MAACLGREGWWLNFELRQGKQHCQKATLAILGRALGHARQVSDQLILLRLLDGGNDAIMNIEVVLSHHEQPEHQPAVDFLIKWNPRQADPTA